MGLGAATGFGLAAATGFDLAAATRFGLAAATGFGLTAGLGIARLTAFFALGFTRFSALFTGFGRGRLVLTVALAFALAAFFFSGLATALERLAGRRAIGFAGFRAAFFTFFWAMQTFSSQESLGTGLTYGGKLTDNRLLSAIPRAATDSLSKLVIRHRAAQEAPELNG